MSVNAAGQHAGSSDGSGDPVVRYPNAFRADVVEEIHGYQVEDPYRWLEDRSDPATSQWIDTQAEIFGAQRENWETIDHWRSRIEALLGSGTVSPPVWRKDRRFFMRRNPGQEHAVLLCVEPDDTERVLIDPAALDPTGLTTLDAWQPDKQGRQLAYQLSVGGTEESAVYVLDVESGELIEGPIDRARYSPIAWLLDGASYYYVRRLPPEQVPQGEEQFHRRVWLHKVGDDPDNDVLIFGENRKATEYFGVGVSRDGRWLTISASEGTAPRNDLWVADLESSDPAHPDLLAVQVGVDAQTSLGFGRDGRAYVYTDLDAQRGRICVADPLDLRVEARQDLIRERTNSVLEGYAILDGDELERPIMLVSWTTHAVAEVTIHDLATGEQIGELELPGIGTIGGMSGHPDGGHEVWFIYTDHATIPRVMKFDALTGDLTVAAYPPGFVAVPRISATMKVCRSKDGTEVRLMLLEPIEFDGRPPPAPLPAVLYGYGGFGVSMAPSYSPSILSWVEAGGVYAIACLRGGNEEGEWWHRDGMLAKKQNVFDDFISCAEWLIDNRWTTPDQLVISGGSNGGLLVGAVMTQRPDLFAGVHCSAPLLDMLRYEYSGLGATWNVEYGSAAEPEQFEWLRSYSPYHQVREGIRYPATLFTVFDQDTRVDPMHARKMCAALQFATAAQAPILIRNEANVGHGARSVSRSVELSADVLAFMASVTGLNPGGSVANDGE
ncbi:MAG: prolyl oligopeptidase family serine peptidase [Candidatus Nanopelagicales bacterium]